MYTITLVPLFPATAPSGARLKYLYMKLAFPLIARKWSTMPKCGRHSIRCQGPQLHLCKLLHHPGHSGIEGFEMLHLGTGGKKGRDDNLEDNTQRNRTNQQNESKLSPAARSKLEKAYRESRTKHKLFLKDMLDTARML